MPKGDIRWWNPNSYTVLPISTPPPTTSPELAETFGMTVRFKLTIFIMHYIIKVITFIKQTCTTSNIFQKYRITL